MAKNGVSSKVGVGLLSFGTAAAVFSATNPSLFTLGSFSKSPKAKALAQRGLLIGLGLGVPVTIGIHLAFKSTFATIAAAGGFLLFTGLGFLVLETDGLDGSNFKDNATEGLDKKETPPVDSSMHMEIGRLNFGRARIYG